MTIDFELGLAQSILWRPDLKWDGVGRRLPEKTLRGVRKCGQVALQVRGAGRTRAKVKVTQWRPGGPTVRGVWKGQSDLQLDGCGSHKQ